MAYLSQGSLHFDTIQIKDMIFLENVNIFFNIQFLSTTKNRTYQDMKTS